MKAIGFKNFRRFENFPTMKLGGVTMLVGGNNSGKSTVGKAARLVNNFLQLRVADIVERSSAFFSRPPFDFDVPQTGIGLFRNALRKGEDVPNSMEFLLQKKNFIFTITVSGDPNDVKNSTHGNVEQIIIEDIISNVIYTADYNNGRMKIEFLPMAAEDILSAKESLEANIAKMKMAVAGSKDFGEIARLNVEVAQAETELEKLKLEAVSAKSVKLDLVLTDYMDILSDYLMVHIVRNFLEYADHEIPSTIKKNSAEYKALDAEKKVLKQYRKRITDSLDLLYLAITEPLVYIPAHIARQDVFFKVSDKNDFMAQAIHEFAKMRILPNDEEYNFVNKWMQKFEIADDFRIKNHDAEAYELRLLDQSDINEVENQLEEEGVDKSGKDDNDYKGMLLWNKGMALGCKGMGSIHLVILLLQLATNIKRYKKQQLCFPTILIEEPELNLHPKLQSELTDLFLELNESYHFRFVVETHSEYLVRKSQVLLGDGIKTGHFSLESNPFCVYYLTGDYCFPYKGMYYKKSGDFAEPFDPGFFDEAANLDLRVLLNEQEG